MRPPRGQAPARRELLELIAHVEEAADSIARGDRAAASRSMQDIKVSLPEPINRPRVSVKERARVFRRDSFTCCYCGMSTIPEPVLRVLSSLYRNELPWHPRWKTTETHPAYFTITSSCDHVRAGTRHQGWGGEENLVTACALCNYSKSSYTLEELGWPEPQCRPSRWDGLTAAYPNLWEAAHRPDELYHRQWIAAVAAAQAEFPFPDDPSLPPHRTAT